jgi:hypothetical protein
VALVALLLASLAGLGRLSWWWLVVPSAAFLALRAVHARIRRRRRRAEHGRAFYERGLERLDGRWAGAGRRGTHFLEPHHPYADDLDVFGEGSLYELLCGARTTGGEERLAAWLRIPADPATVRERQAAVRELTPRLDLREDLALLGEEVATSVRPDALSALATSRRRPGTGLRLGTMAVTTAALFAMAAWAVGWERWEWRSWSWPSRAASAGGCASACWRPTGLWPGTGRTSRCWRRCSSGSSASH